MALAIAAGPLAAQTTFTNTTTILLPVPPGTGSLSNAVPGEPGSPYPSTINVSGLGTQIQKLTVTINDFRHTGPDDVDMLLVGPQGQKMIVWSDVGQLYSTCSVDFGTLDCNNGSGLGWVGPTVTLDDAALGDLSMFLNSAIVTGTYKPTNVGSANDMFPSPAPIGPYASPRPDGVATFASVFNGANPNGAWSLYVIDDALSFSGRINGGWSLTITTAGTALLPTTTTLIGATPSPSNVGQSVTVRYSVTAAAGTPSGFVTVSDGVNSCTGTVAAGGCVVALSTPGDRILTATYAGNTAFAPSAATIAQRVRTSTTTAIIADTPDPSSVGQAVSVRYAVTPAAAGGPAPTGTVRVTDGVRACTGTVADGTCSIALGTPGARTLIATYAGDSYNLTSVSAGTAHQVTQAATTTVIVGDTPDPSVVGQPYTVSYSVAVTPPGAGTPSGTVTVSDGSASCTGTLPATSCQLPSNTPGAKSLTATYNGDANFGASTSTTATHQVNKAATTTAIVSDTPDPSASGQNVIIAFAVTGAGGTPTGAVTISDGVVSCSGSVTAGQCALTFTTPGEHALSATYPGDASFAGSLGSATHRVLYNTTTAIISHSPDPSAPGQGFTVTYAVAPTVAGGPALTGAVTVTDGVNACVGTVAAGSCLLALNTAGTRILSANYAGDGAYSSSTSAGILHTVGAPDLTITKTHAGVFSPGQMGATYTIKVTNAGGAPSAGTVTVADILPAGLAAAGISGAGWNCAQPAGPCSRSDALAVNGSFPSLTLVVNVAANAPVSVTNVATVSGGGDSNASNNTARDPTSTAGALQGILTITKWGSATGTVASADGGIDCGATCQHSYVSGTTITIEATPSTGAVFAGWLGACNGNGSCIVDVNGDTSVTANFAQDAIGSISLDIDDDGNYDALTDGILVIRYLFGLTGSTLTSGATAVNANRTDPAQVLNYLDDIEPVLDIDGNGQTDAMTDGLIVLRYLFGMQGAVLVQDAVGAGAMRSTAEMETYLQSLTP